MDVGKQNCLLTLGLLFFLIPMQSCDLGTNPKVFGDGGVTQSSDTPNYPDTMPIRFAIRDTSKDSTTTPINYVVLQGASGTSGKISNVCQSNAANCYCYFYRSLDDSAPAGTQDILLSDTPNFVSCKIDVPTSHTASEYKYVRLAQKTGAKSTGLINIQSTLTLNEIIGSDHVKEKVRSIYNFGCDRVFLQGYGVSTTGIDCQRKTSDGNYWILSLITAHYHYYAYSAKYTPTDNNTTVGPTGISGFKNYLDAANPICGIAAITEYSCEAITGDNMIRYGLYAEKTDLFSVQISLSAGPDKASAPVGFAAPADGSGNCPAGLQRLGTYVARPQSVTSPPSLFLNTGRGNLNDNLLEPVPYDSTSTYPADFTVNQNLGTAYCTSGTCSLPVATNVVLQTITYGSDNLTAPYVCAIPKGVL